jgi:hypothetical protein
MNCDEAIELLPWLLNGTLGEGERREIRRHLETCERCRTAWAETQEAARVFGQHLPAESLVALAYGEPPAGIDPALAERHLAACPECSAELELARTSRRLEEDNRIAVFPGRPVRKDRGEPRSWRTAALAASLAGVVAASGWIHSARELRSVAEQAAAKPSAPVVEAPVVEPSRPEPPSAGGSGVEQQFDQLRAQVEALASKVEETEQAKENLEAEIQESRRPRINVHSETAMGVERGEGDEILLPGDRDSVLTLDGGKPATPRKIEIWSSTGKVFEDSGLLPDDELGQYSILFPAGFLKPGRYTVRLYTSDGASRETCTIRVQ